MSCPDRLNGEQNKVVVLLKERLETLTRSYFRGAIAATLASYWHGYDMGSSKMFPAKYKAIHQIAK